MNAYIIHEADHTITDTPEELIDRQAAWPFPGVWQSLNDRT